MSFDNLKKQRCLVLIGKAGAGKDTVADMIHDAFQSPRPQPFRFSAPLKRMVADLFGWSANSLGKMEYKEERLENPIKTLDGGNLWTRRQVLQYIGTDVFRKIDPEIWINAALRDANGKAPHFDCNGFICTDCRFPNELDALVKHFGSVHVVRLIKDGGIQTAQSSHASEVEIDNLEVNSTFTIEAGNFDGLRAVASKLNLFFPSTLGGMQ